MDWHVEAGEIVNAHPAPLKADPTYVANMKQDIIQEKQQIQKRK